MFTVGLQYIAYGLVLSCLSVYLSVERVHCDKTKLPYVNISMTYDRATFLVSLC